MTRTGARTDHPSTRRSRCGRGALGLSLLEVMIATGIMAASSMALMRLARIGNEHARRSESLSEVVMLAQNKLHALEAGIERLEPAEHQPFAHQPDWEYTLQAEPHPTPGLWRISIAVFPRPHTSTRSGAPSRAGPAGGLSTTTDIPPSPQRSQPTSELRPSEPPRWTLVQWIRSTPPRDSIFASPSDGVEQGLPQLRRGGPP